MGTLHEEIHRLKDQAWEKIFEAEKFYNDPCLDIFEDEEKEKLLLVEVVVDNFKKTLEEASSDEDIRQAFKTEEALLQLDTKLGDFFETWIEVENYRKKVKDKYEALYLPYVAKIIEIIEKL